MPGGGVPPGQTRRRSQPWVIGAAAALVIAVGMGIDPAKWRLLALLGVGLLLGLTLYHASFGFTSAYRRLFVHRDGGGVQAQLLMLGAAMLLFAPVLSAGAAFGHPVAGAVAPAGLSVAVGALLFGLGMQLGGGCGSGTLFTVGGGSTRMLVTLAAFCAGGFWASLHMGFWQSLPDAGAIALGDAFGWQQAVLLQLLLLGVLSGLLRRLAPARRPAQGVARRSWLTGPWSPVAGALLLAGLNFATLLLAGHPWTIAWAFTLWGAKAAVMLGWSPGKSAFWQADFQRDALVGALLDDTTTVMNVGIVLGALLGAGLAGGFRPTLGHSGRSLAAALIGGLAMGYGARIAYGCNIGAFFSGVASTSLHGWLWILAALAGTWVGVGLRPWFGLANR